MKSAAMVLFLGSGVIVIAISTFIFRPAPLLREALAVPAVNSADALATASEVNLAGFLV